MTDARDIRFRGTDPRLYELAQALGLDLAALNTRTLPDAVAAAVEAQGQPDSAAARSLFDRPNRIRNSLAEHQTILKAILAGDEDAAGRAMAIHISSGGNVYVDAVARGA